VKDSGFNATVFDSKPAISRQSVNAIETGKYDPSLPLAFKIARLFNRKIEDIFLENDTK